MDYNAVSGRFIQCMGEGLSFVMAAIGSQLGLYEAIAEIGEVTPETLGERTGLFSRYLKDWLTNQAATQMISYDPEKQVFYMTEAQKAVLTKASPNNCLGTLDLCYGLAEVLIHRAPQELREVKGIPWGSHDPIIHSGCFRHFAQVYRKFLKTWFEMTVPAPMLERLRCKEGKPVLVADVGCGFGFVVQLLAKTYPNGLFVGVDVHTASIATARQQLAADPNPVTNAFFVETAAYTMPGPHQVPGLDAAWSSAAGNDKSAVPEKFDVILICEALHDMADPLAVLQAVRGKLADDGALMVMEPVAGATVEGNFNSVGQLYSAASIATCLSNGMAGRADGKPCTSECLGTLATVDTYRELAPKAGFKEMREVDTDGGCRVFSYIP